MEDTLEEQGVDKDLAKAARHEAANPEEEFERRTAMTMSGLHLHSQSLSSLTNSRQYRAAQIPDESAHQGFWLFVGASKLTSAAISK